MSTYSTKVLIAFLLACVCKIHAQDVKQSASDSIVFTERYGLRLGIDGAKLIRSFLDDTYQGFELNGDYRLTQRLYLAGEIGTEERTLELDELNNTTSGSYFKGGIDYNLYTNWLDMENMIFSGFRIGASTFSQTRNSFNIYDPNNQYFGEQVVVDTPQEFDGLSAIWAEVMLGIKAEILTNVFMGVNVQLKFLVTDTSIDNFENLYIPGFNRTYDSGRIGAGYAYTISYLIPIFKKDKVVTNTQNNEE